MAKILNLDKLSAADSRELVFKGVTHVVKEMTVENYIETMREAARLENASVPEQIEATIDMIVRSIPSLTVADLKGYDLKILGRIVAFVRGDEEGEQSAEPAVEGEAGK